ncbi:hypothetical protein DESUT3_35560 [Desulfuromonas versatilis]|uniref:Phosphotyrosine protein phosphatase I domain-containing protein n=1 Tax=Desulfuromonas versatilis TaxID=2802975 RepID=A0ABM8I043_9BACT|nr:hypothetical protein [Desulfuromonas versatilis]BCR06487.1 hypothetical protein DESUT3_35560 [Desulfuromonas versatilis]
MIRSQALVDYGRLGSAKVAIFIDITDAARSYQLVARHREAIQRVADLFGAKVLLVEGARLPAESIVEDEFADAWIFLVSDGRNRSMTTKKNPQRINLDAQCDWENHAFKEIIRQIKESTRILEDITAHYQRLPAAPLGRRQSREEVAAPRHN